jgi:L-fuconolactonase
MTDRIDAHHHLWRYRPADYPWIGENMGALKRDFLPSDLAPELVAAGIRGTVVVQACQSLEETEWLLSVAKDSKFIRGVVGWAPIASPAFPECLERLRAHASLKGLRHIIQDEPDPHFMQRDDFNRGVSVLADTSLVYDLLVFEKQLPSALEFVDRHPRQIVVLDHIGKPRIKDALMEPWRRHIFEMARRENVYCKLSGMVTEADWPNWSIDNLRPYFDVVIEAFGPRRLMAGSDWPVCLLATDYGAWFEILNKFTGALSKSEKEMIFGSVTADVYHLRP